MKTKESKEALSLVDASERSGIICTSEAVPSNEVSTKRTRRRFNAEYKRRILRESDACKKQGELGALLRREGLYSSMLASWRAARERGEIAGLSKKRGRKANAVDERDRLIAQQQREISKLTRRAEQAEAIIDIQKKFRCCWGFNCRRSARTTRERRAAARANARYCGRVSGSRPRSGNFLSPLKSAPVQTALGATTQARR